VGHGAGLPPWIGGSGHGGGGVGERAVGAGRILVVGANGAVDHWTRVDRLRPGAVHRADRERVCAGGKGQNVARIGTRLGAAVRLIGFAGGETGALMRRDLAAAGVDAAWVEVAEPTRICDVIVDASGAASTVVNGRGPHVTAEEWRALDAAVRQGLAERQTRLLVLCGSLPPGCPPSAYRAWCRAGRRAGVEVIVDAAGPVLARALAGVPHTVKVNAEELLAVTGVAEGGGAEATLRRAGQALLAVGVTRVIVTDGARGAYALEAGAALRVTGRPRAVVSAVGCGDAFLAGFVTARWRGADLADGLRLAQAAALGNLALLGPGLPPEWDPAAARTEVTDWSPA
jgi:1-phosphofructokinase family hexose kinase